MDNARRMCLIYKRSAIFLGLVTVVESAMLAAGVR